MLVILQTNAGEAFTSAFWQYIDATLNALKDPSVYNPISYLFVVYAATFFLELTLPAQLKYSTVRRKGFWTDIFYVIFIDFLFLVGGFFAMTSLVEFLTKKLLAEFGISLPLIDLPGMLSPVAGFIVFFIAIDFLQWLAHFLLHRIEFFWQFHKIHHAQETLGFASTRHFHIGEYLLLKPAIWIPFGLLGFSSSQYVIYYIWTAYFLTFLSHCNIKISWGPLKYIFITPETHYWHHARNIPGKYGINFASSLVIWDLLLGYFYNPADKKPVLGIPNNDVPDTFAGQFIYPFKRLFRRPGEVPQNRDNAVQEKLSRQERRKILK